MTATVTKEYLLYGLPKGETERYTEALLATRGSAAELAAVKTVAKRDGWHSFRTTTYDGSPPDFVAAVTGRR